MIELPSRLSQTLLARHDACPHSAYLGLKHRNVRGHELARGIAFHLFGEKGFRAMIEQGEPRLEPDVAKMLMNEALDDTPLVTAYDADKMRECAYHFAIGLDLDVSQVAAVEQGFALDVGDWTVVGRLDVAGFYDAQTAWLRDWKTQWDVPDQAAVEQDFQLRLYAVLFVFGRPVTITREAVVDDAGPPLGHGVETVHLSQGFPRHIGKDDNLIRSRGYWVSRGQLGDWLVDVERAVRQVDEKLKATDELYRSQPNGDFPPEPGQVMVDREALIAAELVKVWPAVHGSHCSRCPARGECPLDESVRSWAGEINTLEQAQEAAVWSDRVMEKRKATEKEIKAWASSHGPFDYGADLRREFRVEESRETDWPKLEEAVERSVRFGEPFDLAVYRRTKTSSPLKKIKREAS